MNIDSSAIDEIAAAVAGKLKRAGLMTAGFGGFGKPGETNAIASAIAARLAQGMNPHHVPRGRTVSEGMMRLASAVSYKLSKAEDSKTASFNKVASEVAKALYQAKTSAVTSDRERDNQVGVHSGVNVDQNGTSDRS